MPSLEFVINGERFRAQPELAANIERLSNLTGWDARAVVLGVLTLATRSDLEQMATTLLDAESKYGSRPPATNTEHPRRAEPLTIPEGAGKFDVSGIDVKAAEDWWISLRGEGPSSPDDEHHDEEDWNYLWPYEWGHGTWIVTASLLTDLYADPVKRAIAFELRRADPELEPWRALLRAANIWGVVSLQRPAIAEQPEAAEGDDDEEETHAEPSEEEAISRQSVLAELLSGIAPHFTPRERSLAALAVIDTLDYEEAATASDDDDDLGPRWWHEYRV